MSDVLLPRRTVERLVAAIGYVAAAIVELPRNADTAAVIAAGGMLGEAGRLMAETMRAPR